MTRSRSAATRLDSSRYGPWVVLTGASSGIGREFAEQLAPAGFNLVLAARRTALLEELGESLSTRHGIDYRVVTVDLSQTEGGATLNDRTRDLDIGLVISNAGAGLGGDLLDQDLAELHRIVRLNVHAHLDIAHHFGHRLTRRGKGRLLLVSALGGRHGLPHMANESATKGYVMNLGEALHHELAPSGIDVTVLLPGATETPIIDKFGLDRNAFPVQPMAVQDCVSEALLALHKNRMTHITGRLNRTVARLTPRTVSIKLNGRMLARAGAVDS